MRGVIRKTLLLGFVLAAPLAHADGGTIVFSGAIVEQTCSVGVQRIAAAETAGVAREYHCSERANATPGQLAQSYALSVTDVADTALASDPLIVYFAHYLSASPKLVTQTYQ